MSRTSYKNQALRRRMQEWTDAINQRSARPLETQPPPIPKERRKIKASVLEQYLIAIAEVVDRATGPAVPGAKTAITEFRRFVNGAGMPDYEDVLDMIRDMQAVIDTSSGEGVPAASRGIHALKGWLADETGTPRVGW